MQGLVRAVLTGLIGALVCAILSASLFFLLTLFDQTRLGEAIGYSLIVGILSAFVGLLIGCIVGFSNAGILAGALVGMLATAAIAALYVALIGSPGRYAYFIGESRMLLIVLLVPAILTGMIAARLKGVILRS